ncbi:hypothetical protein VNI00_014335 [Paramarasmius palmivorus]|uniref:Uncharacterized protein n=1 Tax=Paramarasmius palmivorus TaxID=297713 RepID=A0AAW0BS61_9AGAR
MRATFFALFVLAISTSAAPQRGRGRGRGSGRGGNVPSNGTANGNANTGVNNNGGAAAGGADNANNNPNDPQQSLTLNPAVIAAGFQNDGVSGSTDPTIFTPSLTSSNNFINFCAESPNLPITNGKQIKEGSCNPAPMGVLPSVDNMPASKFISPKNGDVIRTGEVITIQMATKNLELGNFVNAQENYFAAPQRLNAQGNIIAIDSDLQGHSHVTIDKLASLDSTEPTDPKFPAYFKGINAPSAANGDVTVVLDKGLPAGFYRLASINAAANHQPVLAPIQAHGFLDDMVYFTVADDPATAGVGGQ